MRARAATKATTNAMTTATSSSGVGDGDGGDGGGDYKSVLLKEGIGGHMSSDMQVSSCYHARLCQS
jgi:hypothetical protein